ncbi:hypothetical protein PLICRDRAFT_108812 [Plicaturopsis crispa FD-325 SS-3]|nr:hypothetical protein PLICRDRAFT_108812 [Plicaturopsis crispa FD-325 SS-3]
MPVPEPPFSFQPQLCQRFKSLVWSCLDADLHRSAVFYAERYFAMDQQNHDARHLYATALLRAGQTFSAMCLVNIPPDICCPGCLEIRAKCCTVLGRHRQAREALEQCMSDSTYTPSLSMGSRTACAFPEEAAMRCRSGTMALKGNYPDKAAVSFRQALNLNPMLWEAFEGLCALGSVPDIDELFPPRPPPTKRQPPEDSQPKVYPVATGAGLFTPDSGNSGNLFRAWKPEPGLPQPFRMGPPPAPRDSIATNDSSFYPPENSLMQVHPPRPTRATTTGQIHPPHSLSRPLSSADEAGPVAKKLRSTRQRSTEATNAGAGNLKAAAAAAKPPSKLVMDEPTTKKARARPALTFSNFFSSSGRSQPAKTAAGKGDRAPAAHAGPPTRRSTRLLSGAGGKPPHISKHPPSRDRRRAQAPASSRSVESDMDDDAGEVAYSQSPSSIAQSPRSDASPGPSTWTTAHELAAQEAYETALADNYVYDIMRRFAIATRALAMYNCDACLDELGQLPNIHQQSPWVLSMVGRAHYEKQEYVNAERAFKAVRTLEPYRLWDMEVYSSILWQLGRSVQLSFLAQELLNINPRSAEAWITVGNLFSLQKERTQAMTCFRRAGQMDPSCAYAFTLSGHEVIDEEVDRSIAFFETALRADARHYGAWYGLGTCYMRKSKFRLAEYHYRKAVEIHPKNAVLLGCLGLAVERRGNQNGALAIFNHAINIAPENALTRFRRAKINISLKHYPHAIADLEFLRDTCPDESNVIFQLAKAYRLVGDETKSAQLLAVARDISPKSVKKIEKLLQTVKDDEAGDDRMDEG